MKGCVYPGYGNIPERLYDDLRNMPRPSFMTQFQWDREVEDAVEYLKDSGNYCMVDKLMSDSQKYNPNPIKYV